MFFDEELNKHEASKNKENFGFFTPSNTDYNMSLYEAIYERVYSRWKYHYILALGLLFLLSCNYPIFFAIFFLDLIIQWSMLRYGVDNFIAQDVEYNMDQHDSQLDGGDIRLDPFVFLCYDSLGYVIYGVSNVGDLICSEIYDYENYIGLQNKLKICSFVPSVDNICNVNDKYLDIDILNYKYKYDSKFIKTNLESLSNVIIRSKYKNEVNYYIFFNSDCSYSYFDLNKK